MRWRTLGLSWLLCAFIALRLYLGVISRPSSSLSPDSLPRLMAIDPESLLASGGRLPIACADQSSLELISGISQTLSEELLRARNTIQTLSGRVGERDALLSIHGVGEKRVETLLTYLDPGGRCSTTPPYSVFKPHPQGGPPTR